MRPVTYTCTGAQSEHGRGRAALHSSRTRSSSRLTRLGAQCRAPRGRAQKLKSCPSGTASLGTLFITPSFGILFSRLQGVRLGFCLPAPARPFGTVRGEAPSRADPAIGHGARGGRHVVLQHTCVYRSLQSLATKQVVAPGQGVPPQGGPIPTKDCLRAPNVSTGTGLAGGGSRTSAR